MIQPRHTCTPASLIGHVLRAEDIQSLLEGAVILPNGHAKLTREKLLTWFPTSVQSEARSALETKAAVVTVDGVCNRPTPFTMPEKSPAIQGEALIFRRHNLVFLDLYTT